ncbi:protoglobin domain-containing protein [Paenibacillus glucanolyticus]
MGKRFRIAEDHKRVGLEPKWYLSAFQNLQNEFFKII